MANSKRKCGGCGEHFRPLQTFPGTSAWCSDKCGLIVARKRVPMVKAKEAKQARAEHREAKIRIKTRTELAKEAQAEVNAYVRIRDKGRPCISCDRPDDGSHQRHASHYRSTKACSVLRFNLKNIHASCAQCNSNLSGNLLEYRIRLVALKGADFVGWLECQNETRKYDIDYLKRLKTLFKKKAKLKALQLERAAA